MTNFDLTEEQVREHNARVRAGRKGLPISSPIKLNQPSKSRHKTGRMNQTERLFAEGLEYQKRVGQIRRYWFESIRLRLADRTTYTPDFMVERDGSLIIYEVKGFWRDDARVKIKVAAEMYPCFQFYAVQKTKEGWKVESLS